MIKLKLAKEKNLYMIKKPLTRNIVLLVIITILIIAQGVVGTNSNFLEYGPIQKARLDSSLYPTDYFVQAGKDISFQSASDFVLNAFINLGFTWEKAIFIAYILLAIIFFYGATKLFKEWGCNNIFLCCVLFIFLIFFDPISSIVGGNLVWYNSFMHYMPSACTFVWALASISGKNQNYYLCFILLGIGCLFHIQYGTYAALFVIIYILCVKEFDVVKNIFYHKKLTTNNKMIVYKLTKALPFLVVPALILVLIVSSLNSGKISNKEFVDIYAIFRNPHHISPSTWAVEDYYILLIYIGISFIGLFISAKLKKNDKLSYRLICLSTVTFAVITITLLINYIFIDIFPLRIVAQLQPARFIQIYKTFLYFIYVYSLDSILNKITSINFSISGGKQSINLLITCIVSLIGLYFSFSFLYKISDRQLTQYIHNHSLFFFVSFIMIALSIIKIDKAARITRAFTLLFASFLIILLAIPTFTVKSNNGELRRKSFNELYNKNLMPVIELAERFENTTDKSDLFIADPDFANANYLRLFSNRGSIVFYKNIAKKDYAILEWYSRYNELKGFEEKSPLDNLLLAEKYNAYYIVLKNDDSKLEEYLNTGKVSLYDREGTLMILEVNR